MDDLKIHRYALPREGLILQKGEIFADVAPLPGWSRETLAEALEEVLQLQRGEIEKPILPSVRFAWQTLRRGPLQPTSVKLQALLMGTKDEIKARAHLATEQGIEVAKLKLQGKSLDESAELIHALSPSFRLRLDFNCAWSAQDVEKLLSQIDIARIDYLEEPPLSKEWPLPIALDESLRAGRPIEEAIAILKPTLAPLPTPLPKRRTFSSSHESSVGLLQIATLAEEDEIVGLDTGRFHKRDLLETKIEGGRLHFLTTTPKMEILC